MTYHLHELEALERWVDAGGDEVWGFSMGSWISFGPVSVLRNRQRQCCMAGHLALVRGAKPVWYDLHGLIGMHAMEITYQDKIRGIDEIGKEVLGITDGEAEMLFAPSDDDFSDPKDVAVRFLKTLVNRARQGFDHFDEDDIEDFRIENKDLNVEYDEPDYRD